MVQRTYTTEDFAHSPFLVFYEVTRACDLTCRHCRAFATPRPHRNELPYDQSRALIDQVAAFPKKPVLVLTGGDPMKRTDLFLLIRHAVERGLEVAVTPSATTLLNEEAVWMIKDAGARRLAMSIDGVTAATHDALRGVPGSFNRTLHMLAHARTIGFPVQVNTTITRRNIDQLDTMADLMESLGIVMWSVFFLVPVGRGTAEIRISPAEYEYAFSRLWENAHKRSYAIKTTEAHHYRRYVLQQSGDPQMGPQCDTARQFQRAPLGVNDGRGVMFVGHTGEIYPSGFLPLRCGKFPHDSVVDVYQNSSVFRDLRDSDKLHGKCGVCEYRTICGGSRARSYAVYGDYLAQEPDCVYIPKAWSEAEAG